LLHLRRAHEERYHQGEAGREVRKLRWDDGMLVKLAREMRLKQQGVRHINQKLQRCFPERTVESIKGQRNKKARYSQLLVEEYARLENRPETQSVEVSPNLTANEELVTIKKHMDLSLIFEREIIDKDVIIDQNVLDTPINKVSHSIKILHLGA